MDNVIIVASSAMEGNKDDIDTLFQRELVKNLRQGPDVVLRKGVLLKSIRIFSQTDDDVWLFPGRVRAYLKRSRKFDDDIGKQLTLVSARSLHKSNVLWSRVITCLVASTQRR